MVKVYDVKGAAAGEIKLPAVFSTPYRPDVIQRAVMASQANSRQPYGTDPLAGHRTSAYFRGSRRGFGSMQNKEMARGPRIYGGNPGQDFRERFAPQARGGRQTHPPKITKIWSQKINNSERKLAIASAIAATADPALVSARGHKVGDIDFPIVIESDVQKITKTKDMVKTLSALKLDKDLDRASVSNVRSGRGKLRGRKYKTKKSLLIVVAEDAGVVRAAGSIPGVDACTVAHLNAELLAPGGHAGRLTVWSKSAIEQLAKK